MLNDVLILLFNKILVLNSSSRERLKCCGGKRFVLDVVGLRLKAQINLDGLLIACNNEDETDATIIIPATIASSLIDKDQIEMFRKIKINGDTNFATQFLEILSKLNFDGIYAKISPLQGVALQQIENALRAVTNYFIRINTNTATSISEYLLYETRDIVNKFKVNDFCNMVDDLKTRTDLLDQRIKKIMRACH